MKSPAFAVSMGREISPVADVTKENGTMGPERREKTITKRCFSLIEIMIVVVIIGLIMGLVGPNVIRNLEDAKHRAAAAQIKLFENACKDFYLDMQRYPNRLEELMQNTGDAKWDGPYIDADELPLDPWGEAYEYQGQDGAGRVRITYRRQAP